MHKGIFLIVASFLALACLAGCPENGKQDESGDSLTTNTVGTEASTASPTPAEAIADTSTADSNVVKPVSEVVELNQPFKVEYKLLQASTGEAWIALVPAAVTSTLIEDNILQAVDRITLPKGDRGTVELEAHDIGKYALRLFTAQTGEILAVAEAEVSVEEASSDDKLAFTPPYVTITGRKLDGIPEQVTGLPMIAYWEMAEKQGEEAWIGMIPTSCTARDAAANLKAAVAVQFLDGRMMYSSIFQLKHPGEYLFRIFASKEADDMLCESQVFRVVEKEPRESEPAE